MKRRSFLKLVALAPLAPLVPKPAPTPVIHQVHDAISVEIQVSRGNGDWKPLPPGAYIGTVDLVIRTVGKSSGAYHYVILMDMKVAPP